ncbi:MAG: putative monocarboxylate transporter mch1 [Pycnora praestabilis]|nr:MAG: putative monocarboxylate transporter mch1 [Pycnora praestabilis]
MSHVTKDNRQQDLDGSPQAPLLQDNESSGNGGMSQQSEEDESFVTKDSKDVQSRARREKNMKVISYLSFACAIVSCLCAGSITSYSLYGHLFQSRLHYTQFQVNTVSIAAELSMYLPVPLFGYLCDRYNPGPLSLLAGLFFCFGYTLAAFTYQQGPPLAAGGDGWPFSVMVLGFVAIGMATSCMYLSAVTTCAKNFGRGKHKGFALAMPIAAFGLSGMWQSQIGSRLLYERQPDGRKGDVDVSRFFLFLGFILLAVGLIGAVGLRVVDEQELIDDAVEELERSGLLEDSEFFQRGALARGYGTLDNRRLSNEHDELVRREAEQAREREEEEKRKKAWLLNEETRRFLADRTMWGLMAGFILVTGPGEAFINNLGTIIGTLYPPSTDSTAIPTTAATHVSIVAVMSTIARIFTGTLSDLLAPRTSPYTHYHHHHSSHPPGSIATTSTRPFITISRITFLITFSLIMSLGQLLLASGFIQNHGSRFWLVSALIGAGYGAVFSLTPIICSVVWGVENFGTNWGIVAMVPAVGATVWGIVYSAVYQWAAGEQEWKVPESRLNGMGLGIGIGAGSGVTGARENKQSGAAEVLCYGKACYEGTFWAMAFCVWVACALWFWAWKGPHGWSKRGIAV